MTAAQTETPVVTTEVEEEERSFELVESLQSMGICATDLKKMKEAGFQTVESLLMFSKKQLCQVKGISEAKIEKMQEAARSKKNCGFISGSQMAERQKKVIRITLGCESLNKLLQGGIETMSITQIYGEARTGKTQICHTLAVTSQLPIEEGGGNGKVIFIDTENTFRTERIKSIADKNDLDAESCLDNIAIKKCFTVDDLEMTVQRAVPALLCSEGPFRTIIVDSITAPFRIDFQGRGELADRQQKLGKICSLLMKLAEVFNVAVVLPNQVMSNPDGMASAFVSDPKKPVGGHVLAHACTTILNVKRARGDCRIMKVEDSPNLPALEATYCITEGGGGERNRLIRQQGTPQEFIQEARESPSNRSPVPLNRKSALYIRSE